MNCGMAVETAISPELWLKPTYWGLKDGVGGRQAFFCVPAIAAIPPDISDVGGPTHQIEARLGCEMALFLMSTAKTPGPRDIFTNLERRSLEADEQVNEQVITYVYL
jgi:hypothetical protein